MSMQLPLDQNPELLSLSQRAAFGLLMPGPYNRAVMDYKIRQATASAQTEAQNRVQEGQQTIADTVEFVKAQGGGGADIVAMRYIANLAANAVKKVVGEVGLELEDDLYEDIRHLIMDGMNLGDAAKAQQNAMWRDQMAILSSNVEAHMNRILSPEANPMMALFQQLMPMMAAVMNGNQQVQTLATSSPTQVVTPTPEPMISAPQPVSLKDLAAKTKSSAKKEKKEANS